MNLSANTLSDHLRYAIDTSGYSYCEIADGAGVPQPSISRFMRGSRDLNLITAGKIMDFLGYAIEKQNINRPLRRYGSGHAVPVHNYVETGGMLNDFLAARRAK